MRNQCLSTFHFKFEKLSGIDLAHFFEDGTKLKIHPEIKPPLHNPVKGKKIKETMRRQHT